MTTYLQQEGTGDQINCLYQTQSTSKEIIGHHMGTGVSACMCESEGPTSPVL